MKLTYKLAGVSIDNKCTFFEKWKTVDADMTVERLHLNLRFSHGFISVQNIILASLNHTSIGTVSVNGYL